MAFGDHLEVGVGGIRNIFMCTAREVCIHNLHLGIVMDLLVVALRGNVLVESTKGPGVAVSPSDNSIGISFKLAITL